ncbi:MAG: FKBP-type peptidyl-prolyl cis-trans isomerase [Myxococcota bacterium]
MLRAELLCLATALTFLAPGCAAEAPKPRPVAKGEAKAGGGKADAKADAKAGDAKVDAKDAKFDKPPEKAKPKPRGKQLPAPADLAAAPPDAEKAANGVACKVLTKGTGDKISLNDSVKMHYTGWASDGSTVETTDGRKTPRTIKVNKTPVMGWADALQMMTAGEKRRCWIPEDQTFRGRRGAPEGPLVYEIEVTEVIKAPAVPPDVAAPPADATKTESGLAYKVLSQGDGDRKKHPRKWDKVTVDYSGWTTDGKMFDSSVVRGKPASFGLDKVIAGWTEGVQLMAKGDTLRFWIPQDLAYKGQPGKPAGMLVFDITLKEWEELPEPPPPPPVPEDVGAVPEDAEKTASGLAYKVLKKGDGGAHPSETSNVTCNYSGWTTDGKMFDSSVVRGKPSTFALNRVIKGWTEGLQLMTKGASYRFWIPVELAYQNRPGKPAGMLVFDVDLIEIKD